MNGNKEKQIARRQKILEIITSERVDSVPELREKLDAEGYHCDRATVYRDIQAMGLITAVQRDGTVGIATPERVAYESVSERLSKLTVEAVYDVVSYKDMVKIRCVRGCAEAVAASVEGLRLQEVFCCMSSFDYVIVICLHEEGAAKVADILRRAVFGDDYV